MRILLGLVLSLSAQASNLKTVVIQSDALDRSDPHHVAEQIFTAMNTTETKTGTVLIITTKTNGRITCIKKVDEKLSDAFATWTCEFARKDSPSGFPHFQMTADSDAVEIVASPDYFKDIDTGKIKGATCTTIAVPGHLATPPHDKTTCRFELN